MLGIVGFYAYDAALLLYADEVVFTRPLRRWRAAFGDGATFGGRYLAFPALLAPGAPVFRAQWDSQAAGAGPGAIDGMLRTLGPLRWHAGWLALALFVLVPLALHVHVRPACLIGLLASLYLPTLLAVLYLARVRERLGLSRKALAGIAFDVIACPPFALNLVRRVTLRCGLVEPATTFADQHLDAAGRARLNQAWALRCALLSQAVDQERPPASGGGE